jgi:hypothetical protein
MKMHVIEILYMASIYGLVTEIQKKNYSGFYEKTAAKPFLRWFLTEKWL